jgi:GNAT superfamily N-acetyltransferase
MMKQVAGGIDEGLALLAEHGGGKVALLLAQVEPARRAIRIHDLRVDFDHRREGLATALVFQAINAARDQGLRAVAAETLTDNLPGAMLLQKCGFELAGVDAQRLTNHDLVKESATLFWYAALD